MSAILHELHHRLELLCNSSFVARAVHDLSGWRARVLNSEPVTWCRDKMRSLNDLDDFQARLVYSAISLSVLSMLIYTMAIRRKRRRKPDNDRPKDHWRRRLSPRRAPLIIVTGVNDTSDDSIWCDRTPHFKGLNDLASLESQRSSSSPKSTERVRHRIDQPNDQIDCQSKYNGKSNRLEQFEELNQSSGKQCVKNGKLIRINTSAIDCGNRLIGSEIEENHPVGHANSLNETHKSNLTTPKSTSLNTSILEATHPTSLNPTKEAASKECKSSKKRKTGPVPKMLTFVEFNEREHSPANDEQTNGDHVWQLIECRRSDQIKATADEETRMIEDKLRLSETNKQRADKQQTDSDPMPGAAFSRMLGSCTAKHESSKQLPIEQQHGRSSKSANSCRKSAKASSESQTNSTANLTENSTENLAKNPVLPRAESTVCSTVSCTKSTADSTESSGFPPSADCIAIKPLSTQTNRTDQDNRTAGPNDETKRAIPNPLLNGTSNEHGTAQLAASLDLETLILNNINCKRKSMLKQLNEQTNGQFSVEESAPCRQRPGWNLIELPNKKMKLVYASVANHQPFPPELRKRFWDSLNRNAKPLIKRRRLDELDSLDGYIFETPSELIAVDESEIVLEKTISPSTRMQDNQSDALDPSDTSELLRTTAEESSCNLQTLASIGDSCAIPLLIEESAQSELSHSDQQKATSDQRVDETVVTVQDAVSETVAFRPLDTSNKTENFSSAVTSAVTSNKAASNEKVASVAISNQVSSDQAAILSSTLSGKTIFNPNLIEESKKDQPMANTVNNRPIKKAVSRRRRRRSSSRKEEEQTNDAVVCDSKSNKLSSATESTQSTAPTALENPEQLSQTNSEKFSQINSEQHLPGEPAPSKTLKLNYATCSFHSIDFDSSGSFSSPSQLTEKLDQVTIVPLLSENYTTEQLPAVQTHQPIHSEPTESSPSIQLTEHYPNDRLPHLAEDRLICTEAPPITTDSSPVRKESIISHQTKSSQPIDLILSTELHQNVANESSEFVEARSSKFIDSNPANSNEPSNGTSNEHSNEPSNHCEQVFNESADQPNPTKAPSELKFASLRALDESFEGEFGYLDLNCNYQTIDHETIKVSACETDLQTAVKTDEAISYRTETTYGGHLGSDDLDSDSAHSKGKQIDKRSNDRPANDKYTRSTEEGSNANDPDNRPVQAVELTGELCTGVCDRQLSDQVDRKSNKELDVGFDRELDRNLNREFSRESSRELDRHSNVELDKASDRSETKMERNVEVSSGKLHNKLDDRPDSEPDHKETNDLSESALSSEADWSFEPDSLDSVPDSLADPIKNNSVENSLVDEQVNREIIKQQSRVTGETVFESEKVGEQVDEIERKSSPEINNSIPSLSDEQIDEQNYRQNNDRIEDQSGPSCVKENIENTILASPIHEHVDDQSDRNDLNELTCVKERTVERAVDTTEGSAVELSFSDSNVLLPPKEEPSEEVRTRQPADSSSDIALETSATSNKANYPSNRDEFQFDDSATHLSTSKLTREESKQIPKETPETSQFSEISQSESPVDDNRLQRDDSTLSVSQGELFEFNDAKDEPKSDASLLDSSPVNQIPVALIPENPDPVSSDPPNLNSLDLSLAKPIPEDLSSDDLVNSDLVDYINRVHIIDHLPTPSDQNDSALVDPSISEVLSVQENQSEVYPRETEEVQRDEKIFRKCDENEIIEENVDKTAIKTQILLFDPAQSEQNDLVQTNGHLNQSTQSDQMQGKQFNQISSQDEPNVQSEQFDRIPSHPPEQFRIEHYQTSENERVDQSEKSENNHLRPTGDNALDNFSNCSSNASSYVYLNCHTAENNDQSKRTGPASLDSNKLSSSTELIDQLEQVDCSDIEENQICHQAKELTENPFNELPGNRFNEPDKTRLDELAEKRLNELPENRPNKQLIENPPPNSLLDERPSDGQSDDVQREFIDTLQTINHLERELAKYDQVLSLESDRSSTTSTLEPFENESTVSTNALDNAVDFADFELDQDFKCFSEEELRQAAGQSKGQALNDESSPDGEDEITLLADELSTALHNLETELAGLEANRTTSTSLISSLKLNPESSPDVRSNGLWGPRTESRPPNAQEPRQASEDPKDCGLADYDLGDGLEYSNEFGDFYGRTLLENIIEEDELEFEEMVQKELDSGEESGSSNLSFLPSDCALSSDPKEANSEKKPNAEQNERQTIAGMEQSLDETLDDPNDSDDSGI